MTRPKLRSVTSPVRAVAYLRQSVHRDESISMEMQETACRDYCDRQGYTVVAVIPDPGISGLKWEKRPGVQRALAMIEARDAEVIIVWRWSRLSRKRLHQAVALDIVERAGGRIESALEPFDTSTAGGEFGRDVLLAAAHFESRQKAEQWAEAHNRRLGKGLPPRGGGRFGYVLTEGGGYELDPVTAPVLAEMYARYLDGAGFTAVAGWLNDCGQRTRGEGVWDRTRVTRVLDSGWGAGRVIVGRGAAAAMHPGGQPRVIDEDMWQAYLVARAARRGVPPRTVEPTYVLSGLIRCGDVGCGAPMHSKSLGVHPGYGYLCSRWASTKQGRCVTITRAKAEAAVLDWLRGWVTDAEEAARREAARAGKRVIARRDAEDLAREVVVLDRRLVKLVLDHNAGLLPDGAFLVARDELTATRAGTEARRVDAEARQRSTSVPAVPVIRALLADWWTLPVRWRRDALADVIERVDVVRGEARNDVRVVIVGR